MSDITDPKIDHTVYEIAPVLAHERILERNELYKLPPDFYMMLKEMMKDMDERNRLDTEAHMNSLMRLRLGKIIELSCGKSANNDFNDVMTVEERTLFSKINTAVLQLQESVMNGDATQ